jgi:hypothetical protein
MERLQVGDLVRHADGDLGKVLDVHGDTRVRVQWERDGDLWSYTSNVTLVSRPEVEPQEPRPFQVGDWVKTPAGYEGVVTMLQEGEYGVEVRLSGGARVLGYRAKDLALVAPITLEGDAAVLPAMPPEPPEPYERDGATRTNPAGFPTMPEAHEALMTGRRGGKTETAAMVDGALAGHRGECQRYGKRGSYPCPACESDGPRLGDLVTAWYQEEGREPARLTGVLVEMEDRFITLRRSGRCNVCIRAGANVVTRKESM